MSKYVLLIYPKSGFEIEFVNIHMPMCFLSIAAPLLEKEYEVEILDQRIEKKFFEKLERCLEKKPVCVGISTMTGTQILYALEAAEFVRKITDVPIVWGGVHPSLTAEQTIKNEFVDIVVRGEGDITFTELVEALDKGRSLKDIKGITWKQGQITRANPDREFCDLDKLAPINFELINVEKYLGTQVPGKNRCLNVYTSRGCPRHCSFCYNTEFNKSNYRIKDIDKVIQEIEGLIYRYKLDSFCINEDNFSVDIPRTHYFCQKLIEKKIKLEWAVKGMEIWQMEKIDFELLEKSGCKHIYMGIESGSDKILKLIKRSDTVEKIKNIVEKFSKSKIIAHYEFVIGFPDETPEDLNETINLAGYIKKTDPKAYFSSFHIFTPFPGTELFRIAVEKHSFVPPHRLEDWYNFRLEAINVPWISQKMRNVYLNICLITYFIDRKIANRVKNKLVLLLVGVVHILAKWHWNNKQFSYCPEFKLLNWLTEYKVHKKISSMERGILGK